MYRETIKVTVRQEKITNSNLLFAYGACHPSNPLNSTRFISTSANKLRFSNLLLSNGFYTPEFINNRRPMDSEYPVLIRKTLTGYGGQGIVLCTNSAEFDSRWSSAYYWTVFVHTAFELRVHVFEGEVIKIFKKECSEGEEVSNPIRNVGHGYHFSVRDISKYSKVIELVNKLNSVINGTHYGLDLGYDSNRKEYFVFECNTGCGLNTETAQLYADLIYSKLSS
jgi:glutathione synthase/RimK-type ligase-like ATP-grasp enzyme